MLCSLEGQQSHMQSEVTAFRQQVEASGLLQVLPRLFSCLAEQVQFMAPAVPCLEPLLPPQPHNSSSSSAASGSTSSSTRKSGGSTAGLSASQLGTFSNLQCAVMGALQLYTVLSVAWPLAVFVTEVVPGCTASVLQLIWLAMQHTSEQLPDPGTPLSVWLEQAKLSDCWRVATEAASVVFAPTRAGRLAACAQSSAAQHRDRLQACHSTFPVLAVLQTAWCYTMLLAELPSLPAPRHAAAAGGASGTAGDAAAAGSSSSGGGVDGGNGSAETAGSSSGNGGISSSRSGSRGKKKNKTGSAAKPRKPKSSCAAAWDLACREAANVPATHRLLLQMLNVSEACILFFAASRTGKQDSPADIYAQLPVHLTDFSRLVGGFQGSLGVYYTMPPSTTEQRQAHLLLPSVLLYWAAHQPALVGG